MHLPLPPESFVEGYAALISADVAATLRMAEQLVGREATSDDVELATWILAKMGEAQSAADVASALWTMQTFSRQWLGWSSAFDVLLTPTVGVPPMPIGAYKLSTLQRQGLKLLGALPAGALLSQRAKVVEAFEPVFEAAPYTMVANVTGQPSHVAAAALDRGRPADGHAVHRAHRRRGDAVPARGAARAGHAVARPDRAARDPMSDDQCIVDDRWPQTYPPLGSWARATTPS